MQKTHNLDEGIDFAKKSFRFRLSSHLLIITKKPYTNLQSVPIKDLPALTEVFEVAQSLAAKLKIADNYRIVTNNGAKAGQHVFHLHFHLIGGKKLNHLL